MLHTYASGRLEENVDRDSRVTSPAQRGGGGHAVQNTGSSRDSAEVITPWLLNLRQAAKYLGCSFWTIRDYALQGLICAVRLLWLRRSEA